MRTNSFRTNSKFYIFCNSSCKILKSEVEIMEISLLVTAALTILSPLLTKAGEKAAETIGEKLANKATEKGIWQKVKSLFIVTDDEQVIEQIENKSIATQADIASIEEKLTQKLENHPKLAGEIQEYLHLSSTNMFVAERLLRSIQDDRARLVELYEERRNAGIESEGQYENMIARTRRRLEKDEREFIKLVTGK